jgi:cysteine desulfurase
VRPEVLATYLDAVSAFADTSAAHAAGRESAALLTSARARIGAVLGVPGEQVWLTSGGTEADALALATLVAAAPVRLVVSSLEHAAVAKGACALGLPVETVAAGRSGRVDIAALRPFLPGAAVSIIAGSNETGALQPVSLIADECRAAGAVFHTDAVQLPGRAPLTGLGADLITLSSHKLGAPGGVGCVIARQGLTRPWQSASNVAGAVAFAHALELLPSAAGQAALAHSRDALERDILAQVPNAWIVAGDGPRLANTSCIAFAGAEGEAIMMALDVRGIAVSTGSACSSGSIEASPVLLGMGLTPAEAKSTIRLSLARALSDVERARVAQAITEVVGQNRNL